MPLYGYRCEFCGEEDEILVRSHTDRPDHPPICAVCDDEETVWVVPAVVTIGPMPSKPLALPGAGVSFSSVAELRRYERENPTLQFQASTDTTFRNMRDGVQERCERRAKAQGFRDFEQKRAWRTAEKKKQRGV